MGWLRLVGSIKLYVSFADYHRFYRALLAKETYDFIDPTNQSHPIRILVSKCSGLVGEDTVGGID